MLCENLKNARKQKGLTQNQLADQIGVQRAVISKYESGLIEPSIAQVGRIADALDVSLEDLLGLSSHNDRVAAWHSKIEQLRHDSEAAFKKAGGKPLWELDSEDEFIKILNEILYIQNNFEDIEDAEFEMGQLAKIVKDSMTFRGRILTALDGMNADGQSKVADYAEDILPRYRAEPAPESTPSTDTTPAPDAPETPLEGE